MPYTPESLPDTGRLFLIRIPDSPACFALFLGALSLLQEPEYWQEHDAGETAQDTADAFIATVQEIKYSDGTPE